MMNYTPIANEYKGDDSVRAFTRANTTYRQNKKRKRQKKQISQQHSTKCYDSKFSSYTGKYC